MGYSHTAEIYYSSVYSPDVGGETMVRNCRKWAIPKADVIEEV